MIEKTNMSDQVMYYVIWDDFRKKEFTLGELQPNESVDTGYKKNSKVFFDKDKFIKYLDAKNHYYKDDSLLVFENQEDYKNRIYDEIEKEYEELMGDSV